MCTTCGCSGQPAIGNGANTPTKNDGHAANERLIRVEKDLLEKNTRYANKNRLLFDQHSNQVFNLVSSPGSGKTTLLVKTISSLNMPQTIGVIEGDQQTENDAARIRKTGAKAVQINTGKGCHLDAHTVGHALAQFNLTNLDLIFIENVGNLVCPAAFDLGERSKVLVLSVTEGDDKPLKYPDMFSAATLLIINKIDLLPYVDFDVDRCIEYARRINPAIDTLCLSATSGEGFDIWINWLKAHQ